MVFGLGSLEQMELDEIRHALQIRVTAQPDFLESIFSASPTCSDRKTRPIPVNVTAPPKLEELVLFAAHTRARGASQFQRALTQTDLLGPPGRCSGCWPRDGEVAGGAVATSF